MQFRLTRNFARDSKIKKLIEPNIDTKLLDDWFVDYMLTPRKKVAIITHAKTAFTFFISYEEAGGAKNIPKYFQKVLNQFFTQHALPDLADEVVFLFSEGVTFTKTVDRKILGYMNDFIRCSQPLPTDTGQFDCIAEAEHINNMPINLTSRYATYAIDQFNELLNINIPRQSKQY